MSIPGEFPRVESCSIVPLHPIAFTDVPHLLFQARDLTDP